ncbi:unnamed protein product [Mytilus edulis]|uniref:Mab-21-like HhH/H2TH-like domain-containing protein n=1 Tax=Mytilus edulis TaxID=6550 RepID=A0A8S3TJH0_MYTED|nr:unnamed protein product [Mytilus edulis]
MNHTDEELSLEFYHYVCNIVGSDDVVKTRRVFFTIMDYFYNSNGVTTFISSGSKAEGLDIEGSDFDTMCVIDCMQVYQDIKSVINCPSHWPVLMETNDTKPGFTKLKVDPFLKKKPLWRTTLDTLGEETFISSKRFRELFLASDLIIHGPCISDPDETFDNAFCLRCKEWITSAQPWINRPRSTWPDYKLVTSIVQYDQELSKYVMSLVSNPYTQAHHPRNLTISNKSFYRQNHIMFGSVKLGLSSDVLNSWILFASSLYQCKRLKECIYIINYCLSKCTPDKIACYLSDARYSYSLEEQTVFNRMRQRVGLIATCKNLIIQDVVFYYPFILLPAELIRLPRVSDMMFIPSVVYCHVLLFLCFHHLRDYRGKLTARRDLELTIRERYFISHDEGTLTTVNQCLDIVKALI